LLSVFFCTNFVAPAFLLQLLQWRWEYMIYNDIHVMSP
jgi:hypothetical protein